MARIYSSFSLGDMTARYLLDEAGGNIGWVILPTARLDDVCPHRPDLSDVEELARISDVLSISLQPWFVQPLVELSVAGDVKACSLGQGQTLRRGSASLSMKFVDQQTYQQGWQAVCRYGKESSQILVVAHRFEGDASKIVVPLRDADSFVVERTFADSRTRVAKRSCSIEIDGLDHFAGCGVLLSSSRSDSG